MRHTTNKRGFTLTEIMLVIAIIVILVGAVSAGIAIDLNRYKNHLASLTTDEGESAWEIAARSEVAGIFGAAASDNAIALASQSAAAESSIAAAGLASQSAAAVKASEAAVSASAAAVSDAAVSASAAAATTAGSTTQAAATTQSSGGNSGSVPAGWNVSGGLVEANHSGVTGIRQNGNSTVVTIDSGNYGGAVDVTFTKNSDNTYTISSMSGRTDLVQNLTSQYHGGLINSSSGYVLTTDQYDWLRNNYGVSLPSGYVAADSINLSGGLVSSTPKVYYKNDTGVTSVSGSGNSATLTVNNGGNTGTFTINRLSDGTYTFSGDSNVYQNYVKDYWRANQDPNNPYSGYVSSFSSSDIQGLLNKYNITLK